jgi:hypothetical protein
MKPRAHLATCIPWRPVDGPPIAHDEADSKRLAALRRWRGQDKADEVDEVEIRP